MIPFNKPFMTGRELAYIAQAHANGHLAGNGAFSKRCSAWLEDRIGSQKALLTHSCTAALEMAAILSGVGPGDEVIMPSFTFVSTANAFVLRGATPGLRRHPAGHAEHRRDEDRGGDHAADEGDRPGPLRRRRLRHGRDHGHRRPARPASSSRTPPRASSPTTTAGRSAGSATWRPSRSTRRRTSSRARAARCSSTIRGSSNAPRSSGRRAPTGASSSAARSTSTPGSTSARRTCPARSSPPSSGRRWRSRAASRRAAWRSGTRTTRRSRTLERAGHVRRPIVPPDRSHNAHMYYLLLPDLARRTAFIDRLKANDDPVGVPLHPAALVAVRAIGRPVARRHVGDGRRQRSAGAAAAVARSRGRAAQGHRSRSSRRRKPADPAPDGVRAGRQARVEAQYRSA